MKKFLTIAVLAVASALCLSACNKTKSDGDMTQNEQTKGKRVLVAFFSRTGENYGVGRITKGNTHIVAEMIAEKTGGDLFEIVPEKAYPDAYEPCTEVAQKEKTDNARPAIKQDNDVADYDIIFIGYPIWWGDAPMPVYTWIEKHQWQGKTVIPFCTHEGSGLGQSGDNIGSACKGSTLVEGFSMTGTTAQKRQTEAKKTVEKWIDGLNINF